MKKSKESSAYFKIIEAFRFTESFDDIFTCKEVAELFLNLSKHFIDYESAGVWLNQENIILASRGMTQESETSIGNKITSEWLSYFQQELRPIIIPKLSSSEENSKDNSAYLAVPLFFSWRLLGFAILSIKDGAALNEWKIRVIEILSRSAGVAMGRITQSKEIESERAHTKSLLASIVSPLIVLDPSGRIIESNLPAVEAFGKDISERHYFELFGFIRNDPIKACLDTGKAQHRVEVFGRGGRLWGITVSPHLFDSNRKGAIIGFRDLTEFKEIEDKLASAERQAIIGRLAGTVAHEINNPLAAMKAHLKLITKKYTEDEETVLELKILSDQIDRIARTVRLLLDFSRQRNMSKEIFQLSDIIRTVAALFEQSFKEKGIKIELNISNNLPSITANPDQFQELMVNLFENARDALSKNNRLNISVISNGKSLIITMEDDGPGLGEKPERIFEPFYTTKPYGTGLGLTIVRKICESAGGKITAKNRFEDEHGASFRIELSVSDKK